MLIFLTLVVYSRVTQFPFTHYDDNFYVIDNDHIKSGLTGSSIEWAFTGKYDYNWMPLTWVSFMIDHEITSFSSGEGGADESASVYHQTNLVLHILNTLLLFGVLYSLTSLRWRSAFAAALFALHPLHVESVAWVAERKDVLSTFFMLLAILAYIAYTRKSTAARYMLVIAAFALGLMAKSMLVTLPIVLLLLDFWPLRRLAGWTGDKAVRGKSIGELFKEKIPMFALSIAVGIITFLAQKRGGAVTTFAEYPMGVRLANAVVSCMRYLEKMLWPKNLAFFYPHPGRNLPVLEVVGCAVLLFVFTWFAIRIARIRPYITFGWLWYLVTLLPVIGIVQVGEQAMADRYTYVPLIGIFIMVSCLAPDVILKGKPDKPKAAALGAMAGIIIAVLMILAYIQVGYWRDDFALFGHAVEVTRNNAVAHYQLGVSLAVEGETEKAFEHIRESVKIDPGRSEAQYNLGELLLARGDTIEGRKHLAVAVRLAPDDADSHLAYGNALVKDGDIVEGVKQLRIAHRLKPDDDSINQTLEDAEAIQTKAK